MELLVQLCTVMKDYLTGAQRENTQAQKNKQNEINDYHIV